MEKQITIPNITKQLIPLCVLALGIFCALFCNQRISYWLIGLFAYALAHSASSWYLLLIAICAMLENFVFLGSSIETAALFGLLVVVGIPARKYLYNELSTASLITLWGLALQILCIEWHIHNLSIGGLYTLLKLCVTLVGVWVVSLTYKLFER